MLLHFDILIGFFYIAKRNSWTYFFQKVEKSNRIKINILIAHM